VMVASRPKVSFDWPVPEFMDDSFCAYVYEELKVGVCVWNNLTWSLRDEKLLRTYQGSSRDSGLDYWRVGIRVPVGSRIFTFYCPYWLWVQPSLLSSKYRGLFPLWIKRQGRESDHSPPTSGEVKKTWVYTSTPLYVFMA
jgi:hypothetical protein